MTGSTTITIPSDLAELTTQAINACIQSTALQSLQFAITSGCTPSVLNDMYFCSAATVSGSVEMIPHDDLLSVPHEDSATHTDTNNHVDSKLAHDDAHFDLGAQSHTDSKPHDDTSTPHDDTKAHYDTPPVHVDVPTLTANYKVGLTELTGAGSMVVSNLNLVLTTLPDSLQPTNVVATYSANISFSNAIKAYAVGSISALGLPALSETPEVTADGTTGTVAGNVTLYCSGNSGGNACGFYAVITSLKIQLPTTVAGYPQIDSVTSELSSIGYPTSWVVPAVNEVLADVAGVVDSMVSPMVESELNKLLSDMLLAPYDC